MKHVSWLISVVAVCLLLATTGCGGKEPIIETAAADMNLSAEDLGTGWTLVAEQGPDEMSGIQDLSGVRDANSRMFGNEEIAGMVISVVVTTESVATARQQMQGDLFKDTIASMEEEVGITMENLTPPDVGDEAQLVGGTEEDLGINVYMCVFRKANVVALFTLIGSADAVDEGTVAQYAQAMEAKMH